MSETVIKDFERLSACPFCGRFMLVKETGVDYKPELKELSAYLRCFNCGACGPEGHDPFALWQQRAEDIGLRRERCDAIRVLRQICEDYGDNEWADNLHLADVLEKHLWRWLEEGD